jgi:hypothetical protein
MDSAEPDELFLAQVDGDPMVDKEEGTHDARLVLQPDLAMEIASGRISDAYSLATVVRAQTLGLISSENISPLDANAAFGQICGVPYFGPSPVAQ